MTVINDLLQQVRDLRYSVTHSNYPGYRMTARSREEWDKLEKAKAMIHREWAERDAQAKREKVVERARQMIEWSHTEYEMAKVKNKNKLKILLLLTTDWTPERVLSRHKNFKNLCRALDDEKTWRMLNVKERRFIADAVNR